MSDASLLLDTCAMIYVANDAPIDVEADRQISEAAFNGRLYVCPMSAWEMGIGVAKGRLFLPLPPLDFFKRFLTRLEAKLSALTPEVLVGSSNLPGETQKDPVDRILMASARLLDMVLVTRDRAILAYGERGHLRTLAC
jgi:PIN domain nuclease of toxin-antitoxin system